MSHRIRIYGGAALAAGVLALAVADNVRPWRRLQVEFLELERRYLRERLAEARPLSSDQQPETTEAGKEKLENRRAEVFRLASERERFQAKLFEAERRSRSLRFELGQARYEGRAAGEILAELLETRMEIEGIQEFVEDRETRLRGLRSGGPAEDAEHEFPRFHRGGLGVSPSLERLERRLAELDRGALVRGLPLAGLFHPSVAVREVTVTAANGQVDRCATCHLAAARDGFEDETWREPFRSHPRLELFVGAGSPHPHESFGCTVCHGGNGRLVGFDIEDHTPIWPSGLVEIGCVRCHGRKSRNPEAVAQDAGRLLISRMGCGGCHELDRSSTLDLPRPGPSLAGIAAKTRPAWVFRWLATPREARPTSWMPGFFDLERGDAAGRERQTAELRAIVDYLWERSARREPSAASGAEAPRSQPSAVEAVRHMEGDAESGRELFRTVGCTACHLVDPGAGRADFHPGYERLQGPDLARVGSKVSAAWLVDWLRDPRGYRADTPMPHFRLSDREAADLTAYLTARRDPAWEGLAMPPMPVAARDELVLAHLRRTSTVESSHASLEGMTEDERNLYLGEQTIARYGCHGCHDIPGFENVAPLDGGDLSAFGDRTLGAVELTGWLAHGRVHQDPPELRWRRSHPAALGEAADALPPVPDHGVDRQELEAILVNLLGWTSDPAPADSARDAVLAPGREVIDRYGCRGCHRIEGRGGTEGIPDLAGEGARVRSDWLFEYLRDPGDVVLRSWLAARMPTFNMSDGELDALVRYFAERDGRLLFDSAPAAPGEAELLAGEAVFSMLQCGRCHPTGSGAEEVRTAELAPPYHHARQRLRPEWVVNWILDPRRQDPETSMPVIFSRDDDGRLDSTYLIDILELPMFSADRERLLRAFETDEQLDACLSDPVQVASALRAYLWSLEK